jgi:hypothetical protein
VKANDEVIFAYAHTTQARPTPTFLKLSATRTPPNTSYTLKVEDGANVAIEGVGIYQLSPGVPTRLGLTNASGVLVHTFAAGTYELKADKMDDFFTIRSKKLTLVVT